ncbi:hypothetical protein ACFC6L_34785 [Kitasatospora phosalacinea]|uniref:hypothetical protein n=1 Tax=Kitasatospora phosalacinea TaxID=2065 RepID=UPI0035DA1C02
MASEDGLDAEDRAHLLSAAVLDGVSAEELGLIGGAVRQVLKERESGARIEAAASLAALSEQVLLAAVAAERADGASWNAVGKALGITRSAAHGRFAEAVAQHAADGRGETASATTAELFDRLRSLWGEVEVKASEESQLAAVQSMAASEPAEGNDVQEAEQGQLFHYYGSPSATGRIHRPFEAVVEALRSGRPVVMAGPSGTGKTYLVTNVVEAAQAAHPGSKVVVVQAGQQGTLTELERALSEADEVEAAERVSDFAGCTADRAVRSLLRHQHDLHTCVDLDGDVLVTDLPPLDRLAQRRGRTQRHVEERLTDLEAQIKMILERLPERSAEEKSKAPGSAARS